MGLFYFRHFTPCLIEIIPVENNYCDRAAYPSVAHYMILQQFIIMVDWLELAKDLNVDYRVKGTVECLGWCVVHICEADRYQISYGFTRDVLNLLFVTYFDFSRYPDNIGASRAREWLEKIFLSPKLDDCGLQNTTDEYLKSFQYAWNKFDKVRFEDHDNGSIQQFARKVLTPLGLKW